MNQTRLVSYQTGSLSGITSAQVRRILPQGHALGIAIQSAFAFVAGEICIGSDLNTSSVPM